MVDAGLVEGVPYELGDIGHFQSLPVWIAALLPPSMRVDEIGCSVVHRERSREEAGGTSHVACS